MKGWSVLRWLINAFVLAAFLIVGCTPRSNDEPPPNPLELLTEAADNIRAADTFRLEARHSGVDYLVPVYLGDSDTPADVAFRRAVGQYVAEDLLQAKVTILAAGLPLTLDIFANGPRQWVRLPGTKWLNVEFAPGFNPESLISLDSGFQAALAALTELQYIGRETLEDGTGVFHLAGLANGPDVTALLVDLIVAEGLVPVDVYIDRATLFPIRLRIVQPETDPDDPTTWTIDVYDVNADPDLTPPEGAVATP